MIEVVALAVAGLGTALFRYLTARELLKRASKKDIPEIARAMYRRQFDRGRQADQEAHQDEAGEPRAG